VRHFHQQQLESDKLRDMLMKAVGDHVAEQQAAVKQQQGADEMARAAAEIKRLVVRFVNPAG
jgi:hypothetical protein